MATSTAVQTNNINNASISKAKDNFKISLTQIALYNFIFMGICLFITSLIIFSEYSTPEIKEQKTTIISIIITSLIVSNIFIVLGSYLAKRIGLSPFSELLVVMFMFGLGYLLGYYIGKAIGVSITGKKKDTVDKDTAALQAIIAASKKSKEPKKLGYTKEELDAREKIEKIDSTIKTKLASWFGFTKKKKVKASQFPFNYGYGISFWFYINTQPPSTSNAYSRFTNILNYGGKPSIKYRADKNELLVTFQLKDETTREIIMYNKLKHQKWNHFVINYDHGTVDVFINDELVATEKGVAPYMEHDHVVAGEKKGINGGIKDVRYYPEPLELKTIKHLFRMY